jgi:D-3-phosphoglycerate dehydrogenase / 2-oxoglutarate reductase
MKTILITDNLFVLPEHEQRLRDAGYAITRLDKLRATEEELCDAIKGKTGYLIGGLEKATDKVIEAADELEAIVVPAIGYKTFLPAWKLATEKGIAVANTPDAPTQEVSEWAVTAALMMNRHFLDLGRVGKEQFMVTKGVEGQKIGIVGLGRTGARIAEMLQVFRPASINYYSRQRKPEIEQRLNIVQNELNEVLAQSDIIFVCITGDETTRDFISAKELATIKQDALLVSYMHSGVINESALLKSLKQRRFRAISDWPMSDEFDELPLSHWYCMNASNTITEAGVRLFSDMAVSSMLNLLENGKDKNRVNSL